MYSNWKKNRELARTHDDTPTLTDQSQAKDTDVNVIVKRYMVTDQAPGAPLTLMWGQDFSTLPIDLRGFIDLARGMQSHVDKLPKELRNLSIQDLIALTPEQLTQKLTPAPTPEPTKPEEPKA